MAIEHDGPIYEVTLRVTRDAAAGLDEWLAEHVRKMLALPGFVDAEAARLEDDDEALTRVVRYHLASDADLEAYLAGPATAMRADTTARFGEHVQATRRVLRDRYRSVRGAPPRKRCLNCGVLLDSQYCGACGQRAQSRLISVWELLKDAFGDLLDADSRLWRTLLPLAIRPGRLTCHYLRGRRARYLPPFRTYLVLSLLFFIVAFFDPREEFAILFEPVPENAADAAQREAMREEILEELAAEGVPVTPRGDPGKGRGLKLNIDGNKVGGDCKLEAYDPADLPGWLGRRLTRERLQVVCDRMTEEGETMFAGFLDKLLDYVPVGLFILLPVMALVLKALYPLARRFYVEHLLFAVHYHAFVFLALTAQIAIARLGVAVHAPKALMSIALLALPVYIPVYLYKSLRRVYEQGHWMTAPKFLLLLLAYAFGLVLILALAAVIAAFSM